MSYFRKGIPLKKKTPVGYKQQSILKIEVREFLIFSSHHFTFYSVQSCNALFQPINLQLLKIQNQEIPYWTIEGILFCKETTWKYISLASIMIIYCFKYYSAAQKYSHQESTRHSYVMVWHTYKVVCRSLWSYYSQLATARWYEWLYVLTVVWRWGS